MKKGLILYYSYGGFTAKNAEKLAKITGFDTCRIKPVRERQLSGFLKYLILGFQASIKAAPELQPLGHSPSDYKTVILGSPIWAGRFTPAIRSVITRTGLAGKTVYPFFCNRGGSVEQAVNELRELLPGVNIQEAEVFAEPREGGDSKRIKTLDTRLQYFGTLVLKQEGEHIS